MKKNLLFAMVLLSLSCFSQITFEKGYFINNANVKKECFIKNIDWKNNPSTFAYKMSENGEVMESDMKTVKEFGINGDSKYIRASVKVDMSRDNIANLSSERNPVYKKKTLFLKVLVEGEANLYSYESGNMIRFFFSKNELEIEPLVYKEYRVSYNKIGENNMYKQQLWKGLSCPSMAKSEVDDMKYRKSDLVAYFLQYNECSNSDFVNYDNKKKRDFFSLTLRPRLRNTSLSTSNSLYSYRGMDLGGKLSFGLGIEAEFIFPFNKNKWAVILEPTYQSYKNEKTTEEYGGITTRVKYNSIELPLGVRHYFFLNNNSKIFINASYVMEVKQSSSYDFIRNGGNVSSLDIRPDNSMSFGVGYKFQNKYSIEARYQTNKNILSDYVFWSSDYQTFSVIFGYSIF